MQRLLLLVFSALAACSDTTDGDAAAGAPTDASTPDASAPPLDASLADGAGDASIDADAGPSCPAGSTLRDARVTCAGQPLSPPASFATAIASASAGDVLSMDGMNEPAAPCLPVLVCTPDDAPTLLFSDSPEMPDADGVLYADTVPKGRYRLYVYHANGGASVRKFPVVVLNQGASAAKVTIVRRGLAAPSTAYVALGRAVAAAFLADRAPASVIVPAGERVLLDADLDALHAAQNELVHAVYDVVTDATLKISFVSVGAGTDATTATGSLSLLARDVDHQRGTFPAADVLVAAQDQRSGVERLRLGAGEVDATLEGIDAATGAAQKLLGNYGMLYRVVVPKAAPSAISARGGAWGGAMRDGTTVTALGVTTTTDAVALGTVADVRVMTAGGSNLPIDLFFVTP